MAAGRVQPQALLVCFLQSPTHPLRHSSYSLTGMTDQKPLFLSMVRETSSEGKEMAVQQIVGDQDTAG